MRQVHQNHEIVLDCPGNFFNLIFIRFCLKTRLENRDFRDNIFFEKGDFGDVAQIFKSSEFGFISVLN